MRTHPIVHVYTVCWNSDEILTYFLRHYLTFAERIVIYDNYSDDRTESIAKAFSQVELRKYDTDGKFDDWAIIKIKNSAYKESRGRADFVVVVDVDELLYHPDISAQLIKYKQSGVTLPSVNGYNMVSYTFPETNGQIYATLRQGVHADGYSKTCIFAPDIDINFAVGAHQCRPNGEIIRSQRIELMLLHYHYVGFKANLKKHRDIRVRLPEESKMRNLAWQYRWGSISLALRFIDLYLQSWDVFSGRPTTVSKIYRKIVQPIKRRLVQSK